MHISDGVLPTAVAMGSLAATAVLAGIGVRRLRPESLPKVAVVTSSFFVASLVHIPFGPTSVHLLLPGIVGALLGETAFLSITLGLLLQSLLFQFGGLTALGANSLMMGIPALVCAWIFRRLAGANLTLAGAMAGGLGTLLAAVGLALLLSTAGENFFGVAKIAIAAHLPVFFIEAAVSAFIVSFLHRVKPELLA
ncbi:MAG: cobalt transporter CbiM [Thermodesulfobacteriota bacterium]